MDPLRSPDLSPRIRVLMALERGYDTVEGIAQATGLAMSTVSKWLSVLAASGRAKRVGRKYAITSEGVRELQRFRAELAAAAPAAPANA